MNIFRFTVPRMVRAYQGGLWQVKDHEKAVYLTFDDGPTPVITPKVLDLLDEYKAKATFFCVGKNISKYPEIYSQILEKGHATGNHTYSHLNGWKTSSMEYLEDVKQCRQLVESNLFRPPYGKMSKRQKKQLTNMGYKIVMWTILSRDFDKRVDPVESIKQVKTKGRKGSILVFHDSEKAAVSLFKILPVVLNYYAGKGFRFKILQ
jgi:peptidoglycan/xylan/chitin deacetylase (PgdA/CDA1 family)